MAANVAPERKIVICGGGIIGTSIAYHLAKRGVASTIIDREGLACAASGKAGGFLARDWCDGSEVGPMARLSFDMHESLSQTLGDTDYRRLDTLSVTAKEGSSKTSKKLPGWLDGSVVGHSTLGSTKTTAQVHPYKMTHAMFKSAQELAGTEVKIATVTGIEQSQGRVVGVRTGDSVIDCDAAVIAMGPWSQQATKWLKVPRIDARRAHSIIMQPSHPVSAHALFVEYNPKNGRVRDPEVYPRPDGDVYICGMGDTEPLPDHPADIKPNEASCRVLKEVADNLSSNLAQGTVKSTQACYLPSTSDGLPVFGGVPGVQGAYIATGHSCWGILNAPATGAAMAQLILDGKCTLFDVKPFDPARFV